MSRYCLVAYHFKNKSKKPVWLRGGYPPPLARIKCHTPLDSVTGFGFMVTLVKVQKYNEQIIYTVYTLAIGLLYKFCIQ